MFIGGALEIVGAIVGIALFFGWKADIETACGLNSGYAQYNMAAVQACIDLGVGITATLVWPSVAISIAAGVLMLIAGFFSIQARTAMLSKGGSA